MLSWARKRSLRTIEHVGEYTCFVFDVFKALFRKAPSFEQIREQFFHIGVMSFSVVAISGFTTGFVLAAQSFYQLGNKGMGGITGLLVGKSMITELGPLLTAFMVTGRVGSAMCAELGSMKVTEQIDAMRSMSVNPYAYLIAPRFIAGIVMIPLLTLFSMFMGIFGGYIVSHYLFHMPINTYLHPMQLHIDLFDLFTGCVKAVFFGAILITICCYKGMRASGGAAGVGKATTQSVVTSYILILVSDFFLTMILNLIDLQIKYKAL